MSAALRIGAEVASALADRRAVVSLETSVIGRGSRIRPTWSVPGG